MQNRTRKQVSGFTLIELMIVVAIVAILAGIAYPSYTEYVIRGKRSEGRSALLDEAARQERNYSDALKYSDPADYLTENGHYQIATTLSASDTAFTLRATPQFTDNTCGYLELTQTGAKSQENGDAQTCWGK